MIWKPNVTVAAIIEQEGRFLLVEEHTSQGIRFNQPAGHLEQDESLLAAVAREAREETAHEFEPQHLVGIYRWPAPGSDIIYLRFAFTGRTLAFHPEQELDEGIIRAAWMTPQEIRACRPQHRSPLVLRCVEDYLSGRRYPLELLVHYD